MRTGPSHTIKASGGCLCGAVRFEVHGALMTMLNCHCNKCRRFHGHVGAYTATHRDNLVMTCKDGLKWYHSTQDETPNVYRGFCQQCGSSLFWDPRGSETISITAGSIDEPTHLQTSHHVWVSQKGDYYQIDDDLLKAEQGLDRGSVVQVDTE